ncbi:MAG TPA: carboxypeptidase-like regulatory domain-containing protein, partial [Pyrinomonadaceae bacterium]|nr:carboxypeptidase-like regulatory domain-containing protein [Pyrinomonadaceae bacterium]
MNILNLILQRSLGLLLVAALSLVAVSAQQNRGSVRGLIADEFGAAIVGASVILIDESGAQKTTTTNGEGIYSFSGLAPGKYFVQASATGFAVSEANEIQLIANGRQSLDITLKVTIEEQKVTVAAETPVSTEATNNANQTLITGKD